MDKEQQQHKFIELRILDQQITEMQEHLEKIEKQGTEIIGVQQALDELKAEKKGSELLVPVANGIFIKASLEDPSNIILNVGNSVAVEKTIDQTKDLLETQRNEIEMAQTELTKNTNQLIEKAIDLQEELKKD